MNEFEFEVFKAQVSAGLLGFEDVLRLRRARRVTWLAARYLWNCCWE